MSETLQRQAPEAAAAGIAGAATGGARRTRAIADIAVHLDGSGRDEAKIAYAETIANVFDAHLDFLFANVVPSVSMPLGPGSDWLVAEIWNNAEKAGNAFEEALKKRVERVEPIHELRRVDGQIADLSLAAARLARTSDLFVVAQPVPDPDHSDQILEAVLFAAGATTLIVPKAPPSPREPKVIAIGWRDTRECSRAVAAALPFLMRAEEVHLISVAEDVADEERHLQPAADMARHLARHGVAVEIRNVPQWHHPGAGLLNEAGAVGADLVVSGAYSRSRFRESIFGGVTRELLKSSPIPILMAH
ncbi:universal stress protein [Jiella sp. M17.18]|uniref:universal stress protein n=1 Tax=Jiella sp. M17.18 TaxID=3234247 RepID=UPI0034DF3EED